MQHCATWHIPGSKLMSHFIYDVLQALVEAFIEILCSLPLSFTVLELLDGVSKHVLHWSTEWHLVLLIHIETWQPWQQNYQEKIQQTTYNIQQCIPLYLLHKTKGFQRQDKGHNNDSNHLKTNVSVWNSDSNSCFVPLPKQDEFNRTSSFLLIIQLFIKCKILIMNNNLRQ